MGEKISWDVEHELHQDQIIKKKFIKKFSNTTQKS